MAVQFSMVIPAWNELERLPNYLDCIRSYLPSHFKDEYEVVVVDDGSTDGLKAWLEQTATSWPQFRFIAHEKNRGKGAAVRSGMLAARGQLRLFADADGASPVEAEQNLRRAIENGADIAVGSRLVESENVTCERKWTRGIVGKFFAWITKRLFSLSVRDTQCGFKMFRADVADHLFGELTEQAFLFDLELLILAECCGYNTVEVPIDWSDVPGSRMSLRRECGRIALGLRRLRRRQRQCKLEVGRTR